MSTDKEIESVEVAKAIEARGPEGVARSLSSDPQTQATLTVLMAIGKLAKETKATSGTIACPVCGLNIAWSYTSPRAARFQCETTECLGALA